MLLKAAWMQYMSYLITVLKLMLLQIKEDMHLVS